MDNQDNIINFCIEGNIQEVKNFFTANNEHSAILLKKCFNAGLTNNHTNIVEWLHTFDEIKKYLLNLNETYINDEFKNICKKEQFQLAQWYYLTITSLKGQIIYIQASFYTGCVKGNLDITQWIYSLKSSTKSNKYLFINKKYFDECFREACSHGNLNIAKWMLTIYPNINMYTYFEEAFTSALDNGYLELTEWFLQIKPNLSRLISINEKFVKACSKGNLEIAQWLSSKIDFNNLNTYLSFEEACFNNQLEVAKWLISIEPEIKNRNITFNAVFIRVCYKKLINIAQWLFSIKPNIDLYTFNKAFIETCVNREIKLAKWLLSVKPDINLKLISENNEQIFINCCDNNDFNMAQWLLSIKPNINICAQNDKAFKYACENNLNYNSNNLELIQWLTSLNPDKYKVTIENNKVTRYFINKIIPLSKKVIKINHMFKDDLTCPICLDESNIINIQTNCGHKFCTGCISRIYNKSINDNKNNNDYDYDDYDDYNNNYKDDVQCTCPYCRQVIKKFYKLEILNITN